MQEQHIQALQPGLCRTATHKDVVFFAFWQPDLVCFPGSLGKQMVDKFSKLAVVLLFG
jgi:hypothetical protein